MLVQCYQGVSLFSTQQLLVSQKFFDERNLGMQMRNICRNNMLVDHQ